MTYSNLSSRLFAETSVQSAPNQTNPKGFSSSSDPAPGPDEYSTLYRDTALIAYAFCETIPDPDLIEWCQIWFPVLFGAADAIRSGNKKQFQTILANSPEANRVFNTDRKSLQNGIRTVTSEKPQDEPENAPGWGDYPKEPPGLWGTRTGHRAKNGKVVVLTYPILIGHWRTNDAKYHRRVVTECEKVLMESVFSNLFYTFITDPKLIERITNRLKMRRKRWKGGNEIRFQFYPTEKGMAIIHNQADIEASQQVDDITDGYNRHELFNLLDPILSTPKDQRIGGCQAISKKIPINSKIEVGVPLSNQIELIESPAWGYDFSDLEASDDIETYQDEKAEREKEKRRDQALSGDYFQLSIPISIGNYYKYMGGSHDKKYRSRTEFYSKIDYMRYLIKIKRAVKLAMSNGKASKEVVYGKKFRDKLYKFLDKAFMYPVVDIAEKSYISTTGYKKPEKGNLTGFDPDIKPCNRDFNRAAEVEMMLIRQRI